MEEGLSTKDRSIQMTAYLMHRGAPKIVEKYVNQRRVWPEISIIFDGTNIVKDKPTVTTVVVAHYASEHHHRPKSMLEGHRATHRKCTAKIKAKSSERSANTLPFLLKRKKHDRIPDELRSAAQRVFRET